MLDAILIDSPFRILLNHRATLCVVCRMVKCYRIRVQSIHLTNHPSHDCHQQSRWHRERPSDTAPHRSVALCVPLLVCLRKMIKIEDRENYLILHNFLSRINLHFVCCLVFGFDPRIYPLWPHRTGRPPAGTPPFVTPRKVPPTEHGDNVFA